MEPAAFGDLPEDLATLDGIVVGHDGSAVGDRALHWALAEAALRGRPLHVVRAWSLGTAMPLMGVPFGVVPSLAACEDAERADVARAQAAVGGADGTGGSDEADGAEGTAAAVHVVHAAPSAALLAAAQHAELVVVGARGHGGFLGLRLGSTADQLVRHAPCPVVVVR